MENTQHIPFLILDTTHRCLMVKDADKSYRRPALSPPQAGRFLPHINQWFKAQFDADLVSPCGQFYWQDAMTFSFILPPDIKTRMAQHTADSATPFQWVALQDIETQLPKTAAFEFWRHYDATILGGYHPQRRPFDVFSFGDSLPMATRLAHLVAKGRKRGTAFWVTETEKDKDQFFPFVGATSLVTDGFGYPICFIETIKTAIVPFRDVPREFASLEGEGDLSMDDWREGHFDYFSNEAQRYGIPFTENAKIFLEEFTVIKKL